MGRRHIKKTAEHLKKRGRILTIISQDSPGAMVAASAPRSPMRADPFAMDDDDDVEIEFAGVDGQYATDASAARPPHRPPPVLPPSRASRYASTSGPSPRASAGEALARSSSSDIEIEFIGAGSPAGATAPGFAVAPAWGNAPPAPRLPSTSGAERKAPLPPALPKPAPMLADEFDAPTNSWAEPPPVVRRRAPYKRFSFSRPARPRPRVVSERPPLLPSPLPRCPAGDPLPSCAGAPRPSRGPRDAKAPCARTAAPCRGGGRRV